MRNQCAFEAPIEGYTTVYNARRSELWIKRLSDIFLDLTPHSPLPCLHPYFFDFCAPHSCAMLSTALYDIIAQFSHLYLV